MGGMGSVGRQELNWNLKKLFPSENFAELLITLFQGKAGKEKKEEETAVDIIKLYFSYIFSLV